MRRDIRLIVLVAVGAAAFLPGTDASARDPAASSPRLPAAADTFPLGEVVDSVVSISDPTQSYALYLPSAYDPGSTWPVLYLMDPRGRALIPMELFREAAERRGWILMSSYDTASDGPVEPNEIALDAMLGDTQRLLAPNMNRLYLCGFSGTARMGWMFAASLAGHVAGMIGVGGGLPSSGVGPGYPSMLAAGPFSFFGVAGNTDFNYEEMQRLDAMLAKFDVPQRLALFEGPHTWLPKDMADRGVDWLEIQAMKDGLRPTDLQLVDELFSGWLEEARELEAQGRPLAAAEAYRALVTDFVNLVPIDRLTEASDRANELERSREVRDLVEVKRKNAEANEEFGKKLGDRLRRLRSEDEPAKAAEKLIKDLKLEDVKRRAESVGDTAEALAAQRLLERTFVQTIFYVPRDYIDTEPERALASLTVARAAKPESPRVCYQEARVYAAAERTDEALDALECLVDAGVVRDADFLENEQYLRTLAGEARFAELMERVRSMAAESAAAEQEGS
jgi:predicted esterase